MTINVTQVTSEFANNFGQFEAVVKAIVTNYEKQLANNNSYIAELEGLVNTAASSLSTSLKNVNNLGSNSSVSGFFSTVKADVESVANTVKTDVEAVVTKVEGVFAPVTSKVEAGANVVTTDAKAAGSDVVSSVKSAVSSVLGDLKAAGTDALKIGPVTL